MKELWTGQAVLSHFTLNCDLDLAHSQIAWYTVLHILSMHMHTKRKVIPTKDKVILRTNPPPPAMGDHKVRSVFDERIK